MGIQGLLPQLKSIMVPIHIKDLKGCSVAVDTYSWLHKGALSCSTQLCKGLPTSRHIEYCMHRVNLLRHFGVNPILVFDGGLLPMKAEQENKRGRVRKENFERAVEHESNGNTTAAFECYQKAVDISPLIARELIQVLKQENVQFVVAPYEADAQMAFLAISGRVDAVITEDSDLIPFGCPRIIFKMDKFGQGVDFQYSMLQKNKELSFEGFNRQMLLEMCILSGCDYLQSLPGVGLKRAHAIIKRFKSYDKVLKHLKYSGVSVPPFYEESFRKAILTFQYQRVYDPIDEDIVHLSNIPDNIGEELDFLGPPMPKDIAQGIAKGDLDPFTKMPFSEEKFTARLETAGTSQFKALHSEGVKKKIDLPVQKNLLTNYFCFASLEAKRKFRAPRISPTTSNHSTLDSSLDSLEQETLEATAIETENSAPSVVSYENWGNGPPANNYIENSLDTNFFERMESPSHVYLVGEKNKSPEYTILRKTRQPIHKPCMGLHKELENTNVQDTIETTTKEATKKLIVRSRFFQHKKVEKNDGDEKQDLMSEAVTVSGEKKNTISDSDLSTNHMKNRDLKRKISPNDNIQSTRQMPPASPPHNDGHCGQSVDIPFTENTHSEEKFGSDISHIGQYSEIAEKSMERFVAVISSFRCSKGSRASGLRAPLRDIRNTCNDNRPTSVDFEQYAYVPTKKRKITRIGPGN